MSETTVRALPWATFMPGLADFHPTSASAQDLGRVAFDLGGFLARPESRCPENCLTAIGALAALERKAQRKNPTASQALSLMITILEGVRVALDRDREYAKQLAIVRERPEHQRILEELSRSVRTLRGLVRVSGLSQTAVRVVIERLCEGGLIYLWDPPRRKPGPHKWMLTAGGNITLNEIRRTT